MREARSSQVPVEKRAADYLQAAAMTAPLLGTGAQETPARDTYNAACGELTVLLRSGEGGRLWNNPLTVAASNRLTICGFNLPAPTVWAPDYFTSFELPGTIKEKLIRKENIQQGVGGALVGVRSRYSARKFCAVSRESQPRLQRRWILAQECDARLASSCQATDGDC